MDMAVFLYVTRKLAVSMPSICRRTQFETGGNGPDYGCIGGFSGNRIGDVDSHELIAAPIHLAPEYPVSLRARLHDPSRLRRAIGHDLITPEMPPHLGSQARPIEIVAAPDCDSSAVRRREPAAIAVIGFGMRPHRPGVTAYEPYRTLAYRFHPGGTGTAGTHPCTSSSIIRRIVALPFSPRRRRLHHHRTRRRRYRCRSRRPNPNSSIRRRHPNPGIVADGRCVSGHAGWRRR